MSDAGPDDGPPSFGMAYELRLTQRALDDLRCDADVPPGDLDGVEDSTHQRAIVEKSRSQRWDVPTGTQAPMRNVGRPDVYSLHGSAGDRACTWYDDDAQVCWFLGWVAQHDYTEFESRALNGELLPDLDDYTVLEVEQENLDFDRRIGAGLRQMVDDAVQAPNTPVRRTVGDLLSWT